MYRVSQRRGSGGAYHKRKRCRSLIFCYPYRKLYLSRHNLQPFDCPSGCIKHIDRLKFGKGFRLVRHIDRYHGLRRLSHLTSAAGNSNSIRCHLLYGWSKAFSRCSEEVYRNRQTLYCIRFYPDIHTLRINGNYSFIRRRKDNLNRHSLYIPCICPGKINICLNIIASGINHLTAGHADNNFYLFR